MSFTITTDIFCDRCHNWDAGISDNQVCKRDCWTVAKARGWTKEKGKHICPLCNGKATNKSEQYGYTYAEKES